MALAEIQLGALEPAEQTAQMASRRFPGDVLFYPVRALIAVLRGERDRALQQVDLTIKNEKAFGHYHHAQYDVACRRGDCESKCPPSRPAGSRSAVARR